MMYTYGILCMMMLFGVNWAVQPRRTDITDKGDTDLFRGWVDVQGQGVKNDYCRFVGPNDVIKYKWLSCALAGTQGASQYNYNPANGGSGEFDTGYKGSWYMRDANGDGRDDYCRLVGDRPNTWVSCMLADRFGFQSDQYGFTVPNSKAHNYKGVLDKTRF